MKYLISIILTISVTLAFMEASAHRQDLPDLAFGADWTAMAHTVKVSNPPPDSSAIATSTAADTAASATMSTDQPADKRALRKERNKRKDSPEDEPLASLDSTHTQQEIPTLDKAWEPVLLDHSIGIKGGWGTGSMRREPTRETVSLPYPLWSFGVTYRFDVPQQKYVGTITFELNYTEKGFAYLETFSGSEVYTRKFTVIELPILWQPYFPLGKGGSRVYLSAGPFLSYTISSYEALYDKETKEVHLSQKYQMDPMEDYYLNYGISAGLGVALSIGRWAITAEARYSIQLSDIIRGPEHIEGNPFRTPVDHIGVWVGVQYKFSIGDKSANKTKK